MKRFFARFSEWFAESSGPTYKSLREVFANAIITLTPVWAGTIVSIAIVENQSISSALRLNTERGDLFVLATALIAPVILYVTAEKGNLPKPFSIHFLGGWFYMVVVYVLAFTCAVLFAVKRISDSGIAEIGRDPAFSYNASIWLYVISVLIALLVTYQKAKIDATSAETLREGDDAFTADWLDRERPE